MELITAQYKFKLNASVLKRYEPSIDGGTLCLYNAANGLMWYGNQSCLLLINLLDGQNTVKNLMESLKKSVVAVSDDTVIYNSIINILSELSENNMIMRVE